MFCRNHTGKSRPWHISFFLNLFDELLSLRKLKESDETKNLWLDLILMPQYETLVFPAGISEFSIGAESVNKWFLKFLSSEGSVTRLSFFGKEYRKVLFSCQ